MKKLMYDPLNIVICGIGGQGNVLAAELVASAMNDLEYRVAEGETYGAAQRGIPAGEAHFIIGFEPLETLRIARRYANPGTRIIYDPRPVYPQSVLRGRTVYPELEDLKAEIDSLCKEAIQVPAADIAMECGDSRAANIALIGAFSCLEGAPLDTKALEEVVAQRFKGAVLALNQKVFALGCEAAKEAVK